MKKIFFLALVITTIACTNKEVIKFKKSDYGAKWPYSVTEIEVYCNGYDEIYFKADNGKTYPLNGAAKGASRDNPQISDIQEIWLDNSDLPGTKIPYPQEFIDKGLSSCENRD